MPASDSVRLLYEASPTMIAQYTVALFAVFAYIENRYLRRIGQLQPCGTPFPCEEIVGGARDAAEAHLPKMGHRGHCRFLGAGRSIGPYICNFIQRRPSLGAG